MRTTLKQALDQTYGCDCGCPHIKIRIVEAVEPTERMLPESEVKEMLRQAESHNFRLGKDAGLNQDDGRLWIGVLVGAGVVLWGVVLVWIWRTF